MRTYIINNFRILLKGTLAFHSSMAALFSASVKGFTPGVMLGVDCTSVKKMHSYTVYARQTNSFRLKYAKISSSAHGIPLFQMPPAPGA